MLAYQAGDAGAFDQLYRRYRGPMHRYFIRQCGQPDAADELFQEVWMKLIRARERYEVSAKFSTYVYHLAHNCLVDFYRKQSRGLPPSYANPGSGDTPEVADCDGVPVEQQVEQRQQIASLLEQITQLPEAQREAFLLHEESDMTLEQIAEVTGVTRETAKSRLRYAFNKLRSGMTGKE